MENINFLQVVDELTKNIESETTTASTGSAHADWTYRPYQPWGGCPCCHRCPCCGRPYSYPNYPYYWSSSSGNSLNSGLSIGNNPIAFN